MIEALIGAGVSEFSLEMTSQKKNRPSLFFFAIGHFPLQNAANPLKRKMFMFGFVKILHFGTLKRLVTDLSRDANLCA